MAQASAAEKKVTFGRQVKLSLARDLQKSLSDVDTLVVARMDKVTTRDLNKLRGSLKGMDSNFIVVKNTLGRITFREKGWTGLEGVFEGTCGISPVKGDLSAVCKLLSTFSKDHEGFTLRGGVLNGQVLDPKDLVSIGKLPSREVLLAQLAGIVQYPIRSLAFLLQAQIRAVAVVLDQVRQKKEKQPKAVAKPAEAPAPAAEAPKQEPEAPKQEPEAPTA